MENLGLIPLSNFGEVLPKVYRSAQPQFGYQYGWLKNVLKIDTIVNLRSEKNIDKRFCDKFGIESITFAVKDHDSPSKEIANEFIEFIKTQSGLILIHCEHGHGRTSTFSVLSKIANGFSVDDAILDEQIRFNYHFKYQTQLDFLKSFSLNNLVESK